LSLLGGEKKDFVILTTNNQKTFEISKVCIYNMKLINLSACLLITLIILVSAIPASMAETLDFENCQGFLSDIEIKKTLQYNGDLEIISLPLKGENMHIRTMCSLTASTLDKSVVSMGVVVFSGSSPALKHYGVLLDSAKNQNVEIYEGKNPWKFFSAELNQGGFGKTVVSQRDVYVLSFNTVETKTSESLATEESLQNLSLLVQQKIIPLAPGSYTPPSLPKVETKPEVKEEFAPIPDWIRNNAKWWSEGNIADNEFVSGIQYLIKEGIMQIPETEKSSMNKGSEEIPQWIKNNAEWWSQGLISDDDFVKGIQYLVENGIIRV